jgi:hypothetical protein
MLVALVAGAFLAADRRPGLWLTAAVVFVNIVIGTQNAWDLLLGAREGSPT